MKLFRQENTEAVALQKAITAHETVFAELRALNAEKATIPDRKHEARNSPNTLAIKLQSF